MMRFVSIVLDVALVAFVVREVWLFAARYRRLKEDLVRGDARARERLYGRALVFQWTSAALALFALRFDWSAFRPDLRTLGDSPLVRTLPMTGDSGHGTIVGLGLGLGLGTLALALARRRAGARTTRATGTAPPWRRLMPDIAALLPVTRRERLLWLAVSVSAGICEELVFRGWLLHVLHDPLGLAGTALILVAAAGFGLGHAYQGVGGVILATLGGVLFCGLYLGTGGLLIPILLHIAVDARFALVPAPADGGASAGITGSPATIAGAGDDRRQRFGVARR